MYRLKDIITFGRYKGKQVKFVIDTDINYIKFLKEGYRFKKLKYKALNIKSKWNNRAFKLSEEAFRYYLSKLKFSK